MRHTGAGRDAGRRVIWRTGDPETLAGQAASEIVAKIHHQTEALLKRFRQRCNIKLKFRENPMPKPQKHVSSAPEPRHRHPRGSCQQKQRRRGHRRIHLEFQQRELHGKYALTRLRCIGPCGNGPSVLVYPEGIMYGKVTRGDVKAIIDEHLLGDQPVETLESARDIWDEHESGVLRKNPAASQYHQKALLTQAGHEVEARSLLDYPFSTATLRPFFWWSSADEWFNPSAPRLKNGEVHPDQLDETAALASHGSPTAC